MPLLAAIDEYDSTITTIAIHAQLGLDAADINQQQAALRLILALCNEVDVTVSDVLSNAYARGHVFAHIPIR